MRIVLVLFESWLLQLLLSCLLTIINANNRVLGSENMEDQSSLCWLIFFYFKAAFWSESFIRSRFVNYEYLAAEHEGDQLYSSYQ